MVLVALFVEGPDGLGNGAAAVVEGGLAGQFKLVGNDVLKRDLGVNLVFED